jgi:DNA-binding transcriptional regulator LsrR (DeoR family)
VREYQAGRTLADLAAELGIHRRTVAAHLERRGVQRRVNRRKMTDDDLREAARRYRAGDSLAKVASPFDVDAATVRRELHRAGVAIRLRRGWT